MKTLIINNLTKSINSLHDLARGFSSQVMVTRFDQLASLSISDFDLILLSGSSKIPVLGNQKAYATETNLILHSPKPIIGICLGAELIAHTFHSPLIRQENKIDSIISINPNQYKSPLFKGINNLLVREVHHWRIPQVNPPLQSLAISPYGVELFKHKKRPVYGLQFHPESKVSGLGGKQILLNIIQQLQML